MGFLWVVLSRNALFERAIINNLTASKFLISEQIRPDSIELPFFDLQIRVGTRAMDGTIKSLLAPATNPSKPTGLLVFEAAVQERPPARINRT
jgi:hypothetical protein